MFFPETYNKLIIKLMAETEGIAVAEKKERGLLVVISGFSGAGKGTLIRELMHQHPNYQLSVSATTRAPRAGEEDGKDYFFVTRERFEEMIAQRELIEYASYVGNYYGTPKAYVEEMLDAGHDVILEIEIQGALKVKNIFPEAVFVFVAPPDAESLEKRLTGRGTESKEQVLARLKRAAEESRWMSDYEYLLVNDDLTETVENLHALLKSQHFSMGRHRAFTEELGAALNRFYSEEEK